ncbi:MAG: hypothetical protein Q4D45_00200 [Lachnospiraceae bacterium]|nr:hypothetical protein [Lachnospiraceae bacterium]
MAIAQRRQQASRVAMRLSHEMLKLKEPIMLDIVVNCQLRRACYFLKTSPPFQLEDG